VDQEADRQSLETLPSYVELVAQQAASQVAFGGMLLNWRRRIGWAQYTACSWADAIGEPLLRQPLSD
jgi:hypothetical protein